MYKLHLILKYLRKRRIAWVSLIAVILCTAMVLVVISVMGGWLRMFNESFHGLSGDILVHGQSLVGFPHYEEIVRRVKALPEVKAASPVIRTFGLVNIENQIRKGVEVVGYPPDIGEVNGFMESLYRMKGNLSGVLADETCGAAAIKQSEPEKYARSCTRDPAAIGFGIVSGKQFLKFDPKGNEIARAYLKKSDGTAGVNVMAAADEQENPIIGKDGTASVIAISSSEHLTFDLWPDINYRPPTAKYRGPDVRTWPGMIVGDGVIGIQKNKSGGLDRPLGLMYTAFVDLTVVPISPESSQLNMETGKQSDFFWIIDDSRTKVYLYDSNTVYVPFERLQQNLKMDAHDGQPARANDIQIALKPGSDLTAAKQKISKIVSAVMDERGTDYRFPLEVQTWKEVHATFIGAVEKEKGLVTILFGLISIVAVFLIFCIFYMIVVEKTRDIGIIKSVGATSTGVAGIFLGYGMAIGIVGGMMGWLVGWLIVHFINQLHTQLGKLGLVVWDPQVYLFDTIPNTTSPREVIVIVSVAIVSSVLGALVPAIRAARMHPIEALRWE